MVYFFSSIVVDLGCESHNIVGTRGGIARIGSRGTESSFLFAREVRFEL
jgi:hypothetical protein